MFQEAPCTGADMKGAKLLLQKFQQSATEFVFEFVYGRKGVLGRFT